VWAVGVALCHRLPTFHELLRHGHGHGHGIFIYRGISASDARKYTVTVTVTVKGHRTGAKFNLEVAAALAVHPACARRFLVQPLRLQTTAS